MKAIDSQHGGAITSDPFVDLLHAVVVGLKGRVVPGLAVDRLTGGRIDHEPRSWWGAVGEVLVFVTYERIAVADRLYLPMTGQLPQDRPRLAVHAEQAG